MNRRGYSLIEMLVVIAVSTILLGIAVGILHLLMRAEQGGRDYVTRTTTVARLADQFRSDVHAALRPIPPEADAKNQWQFALTSDRTVTYRSSPGEVERREEAAGKLVRRESYMLPDDWSAEVVLRTDPAPAMASLVLTPPNSTVLFGHEICLDAALGVDHRFVKPQDAGASVGTAVQPSPQQVEPSPQQEKPSPQQVEPSPQQKEPSPQQPVEPSPQQQEEQK